MPCPRINGKTNCSEKEEEGGRRERGRAAKATGSVRKETKMREREDTVELEGRGV